MADNAEDEWDGIWSFVYSREFYDENRAGLIDRVL